MRWHGWCASRVEEFNAKARRDITATHVGLWRGKQWRAHVRRLRQSGCKAEWVTPSHPDAWHGLGTAAYGAWGRYWRPLAAADAPVPGMVTAEETAEGTAAGTMGTTTTSGSVVAAAEAEKRERLEQLQRQLRGQHHHHHHHQQQHGVASAAFVHVDEDDATHDAFQPITVTLAVPLDDPLAVAGTAIRP